MMLIRGRVLSFHADPAEVEDAFTYIEDGALLVDGGRIAAVGDYADLRREGLTVIDHRPHLILPGFIDSLPETGDRRARIPMGRYGNPKEIADTVLFLLSGMVPYLTGSEVTVDGGFLSG